MAVERGGHHTVLVVFCTLIFFDGADNHLIQFNKVSTAISGTTNHVLRLCKFPTHIALSFYYELPPHHAREDYISQKGLVSSSIIGFIIPKSSRGQEAVDFRGQEAVDEEMRGKTRGVYFIPPLTLIQMDVFHSSTIHIL